MKINLKFSNQELSSDYDLRVGFGLIHSRNVKTKLIRFTAASIFNSFKIFLFNTKHFNHEKRTLFWNFEKITRCSTEMVGDSKKYRVCNKSFVFMDSVISNWRSWMHQLELWMLLFNKTQKFLLYRIFGFWLTFFDFSSRDAILS